MAWLIDIERIAYEVAIAGGAFWAGWAAKVWWEARQGRRDFWRRR